MGCTTRLTVVKYYWLGNWLTDMHAIIRRIPARLLRRFVLTGLMFVQGSAISYLIQLAAGIRPSMPESILFGIAFSLCTGLILILVLIIGTLDRVVSQRDATIEVLTGQCPYSQGYANGTLRTPER